jgi:hypothetical protein
LKHLKHFFHNAGKLVWLALASAGNIRLGWKWYGSICKSWVKKQQKCLKVKIYFLLVLSNTFWSSKGLPIIQCPILYQHYYSIGRHIHSDAHMFSSVCWLISIMFKPYQDNYGIGRHIYSDTHKFSSVWWLTNTMSDTIPVFIGIFWYINSDT